MGGIGCGEAGLVHGALGDAGNGAQGFERIGADVFELFEVRCAMVDLPHGIGGDLDRQLCALCGFGVIQQPAGHRGGGFFVRAKPRSPGIVLHSQPIAREIEHGGGGHAVFFRKTGRDNGKRMRLEACQQGRGPVVELWRARAVAG